MYYLKRFSLFALLLVSSCSVSDTETKEQLSKHLDAYKQVRVSPGNASSIVKSARILLNSDSNENSFFNFMSTSQMRLVEGIKFEAQEQLNLAQQQLNLAQQRQSIKSSYRLMKGYEISRRNAAQIAKESKELLSLPQVKTALSQVEYSSLVSINKGATDVAAAVAADQPPVKNYCKEGSVMDTAFGEFPGNAHFEIPYKYCGCYRKKVEEAGYSVARRSCLSEFSGSKILVQEDSQDKQNRWLCSKFYTVPPNMKAVCSRYGY